MIDFSQLDKTIHEKGRLSIMTLLSTRPTWVFQELKNELEMSDGNLITHLRTLQKAGYLTSLKNPAKRETGYSLTDEGRRAFESYIGLLEKIINASKS